MNWKRILMATIIVYIVYEVINFIVHGVILSGAYQTMADTWRTDMQSKMWVMYIGDIIFALFFVVIFAKGYEGKGLMEGIRYGLLMSGFVIIPGMLAQYSVYEVTFVLTLQWIVFGFIKLIIIGMITALIYKPQEL
ncbi:MAG: hypothetical protein GF313_03570 [Caldithrix sp.]|nr:hypothetical protein [Caldithrix sp.]